MTIEQILTMSGGVASTGDLLTRGVGERAIERYIGDGRVLRVRRGVLALPDAPPEFIEAVAGGARLTCVSAAVHYGLWCVRPAVRMHVSRPTRSVAGCINHRVVTVPPHPRLPLVGVADALVHVLQCRPADESVPMVECALRRGDTAAAFLESRLPGKRNGRARAALAKVDCTAESAIEVVARLILTGAGLNVRSQVPLPHVGRVDFLVEGFLVVEIDGAAFHSDRRALRRDRVRNNMTVIGGYAVLRFCYEDVMFQPEELLAQVLQVVEGRPIR